MKIKRQNELIRLINENSITTQEEILTALRESGYNVTQATISRDMRELKISKVMSNDGTLKYSIPSEKNTKASSLGLNSALTESINRIDYACNDIVIHTHPGLANAVGVAIDSLHLPEVLGCVAGDDTILMITRNEESAREISLLLREKLIGR